MGVFSRQITLTLGQYLRVRHNGCDIAKIDIISDHQRMGDLNSKLFNDLKFVFSHGMNRLSHNFPDRVVDRKLTKVDFTFVQCFQNIL